MVKNKTSQYTGQRNRQNNTSAHVALPGSLFCVLSCFILENATSTGLNFCTLKVSAENWKLLDLPNPSERLLIFIKFLQSAITLRGR